ncbi:hypothetical protein JXA80_11150 [bacterium]|nr:hypothetical protein [candidate division CSSED10-310 bacterium]
MNENRKLRKEILKLEKQMQVEKNPQLVLSLSERYIEIGEPHQSVAVLLEGIQANPDHVTLKVICARTMLTYQTDDVSRAESIIKHVLMTHPENLLAQQLMEQIHAQVETMHEIALPPDTLELQRQATLTIQNAHVAAQASTLTGLHRESAKTLHGKNDIDEKVSDAYALFRKGQLEDALGLFQEILETDPDNDAARDGFRKIYAEIVKSRENDAVNRKREKQLEVIRRSIRLLDAMRRVVTIR